MKIKKIIERLEAHKKSHGNVDVYISNSPSENPSDFSFGWCNIPDNENYVILMSNKIKGELK